MLENKSINIIKTYNMSVLFFRKYEENMMRALFDFDEKFCIAWLDEL